MSGLKTCFEHTSGKPIFLKLKKENIQRSSQLGEAAALN